MCAMDRSSEDDLSQSVRNIIFCIKSIYHFSPVAVCVRNDQHDMLYSNGSFQQLYDFFKVESEKSLFKVGAINLEYVLTQLEFDCITLGQGCVLCKNFLCGHYSFQIRMESMYIPAGGACILWQINLQINLPLIGRKSFRKCLIKDDELYNCVMSRLNEKNLESLSFVILGYTYAEAAGHIKLPPSTVRKRVEKSREIINEHFISFERFRDYLFKTKKIFFFVDYCSIIMNVNSM
ncbi:TPA: hypothetical protein NVL90_001440 [Klebsiella oxytoca]|nr:hypothetical protein [Klebsiella oxytoca]HCJ7378811.1 hypothetical protein [Klebsiella oxytoca]HDX4249517.1 hypothetical protein [Klebsiella oxytoca]